MYLKAIFRNGLSQQPSERRVTGMSIHLCLVAWLLLSVLTAELANAQGIVIFANNSTLARSRVYAPCPTNLTLSMVGNGTADIPVGTVDWSGFDRIGVGGVAGQYGAAGTFAQLLSANGADQPESLLLPQTPTTTFRTGSAAGIIVIREVTLNNVPPDAPVATVQMVAWDNSSGNYPTWVEAFPAWQSGLIAAGKGVVVTVTNIGGPLNPPPYIANAGLQSFNLCFAPVPDAPSIVLQPRSRTVPAGLSLDFAVTAVGAPELHYQWFFDATNALFGSTNSVLPLAQVQPSQAGTYWVVVSNAFGTVTSAPALLTVTPGTYSILHSFPSSPAPARQPDLWYPREGALVVSGSTLYGTTWQGGSSNYGTIFTLDARGSGYSVIKSFSGGVDGECPLGLVWSGTTLYGTTYYGGDSDGGTVFKLNPDGSDYTVLKSFSYVQRANGGLRLSGETLYGTAVNSLFRIDTAGGGYTELYSFGSGADGAIPVPDLVLADTTLYGMTWLGGVYKALGEGVLYKVNTDGGAYQVMKRFARTNEHGYYPLAGLALSGETLYGTTSWGGPGDRGTVFKCNSDGSGYTVLHSFSGPDGALPCTELLVYGSVIFGTTLHGGSSDLGTIFQLNTDGSGYTVLLDFTGREGAHPNTALVASGTNLFGMTESGGDYNGGVVFSLALPPPLITQSPQSQTAEAGADVRFSARATGCGLLVYQWFLNGDTVLSEAATNSALVLTNVQVNSSGAYTVIVSNLAGAVTSAPAILSVISPVERRLVPGVKLMGEAGSLLNVDYADSLSATPTWLPLDTMSLGSTSQYYFDLTMSLPPERYYRAWQTGTPGSILSLELQPVPAITLTGSIGNSVRVDGINRYGPIDAWFTLDTVVLTNTSQLYFDTSAWRQPERLYRLVPVP